MPVFALRKVVEAMRHGHSADGVEDVVGLRHGLRRTGTRTFEMVRAWASRPTSRTCLLLLPRLDQARACAPRTSKANSTTGGYAEINHPRMGMAPR